MGNGSNSAVKDVWAAEGGQRTSTTKAAAAQLPATKSGPSTANAKHLAQAPTCGACKRQAHSTSAIIPSAMNQTPHLQGAKGPPTRSNMLGRVGSGQGMLAGEGILQAHQEIVARPSN